MASAPKPNSTKNFKESRNETELRFRCEEVVGKLLKSVVKLEYFDVPTGITLRGGPCALAHQPQISGLPGRLGGLKTPTYQNLPTTTTHITHRVATHFNCHILCYVSSPKCANAASKLNENGTPKFILSLTWITGVGLHRFRIIKIDNTNKREDREGHFCCVLKWIGA